ncbi:prolyl oligopeptidase family serine peptidase [Candidatus Saccharibacteria bacterium]|nr:prolyl oligopeptidase family serine peptidase [Candidatus Saccharibacteria bacterium]
MIISSKELASTCISTKHVELSEGIKSKLTPQQLLTVERHRKTLDFLAFRYQVSSGAISAGFLIAPIFSKKKKLPVMVYLRGGTADFGIVNAGAMYLQLATMAKLGYIVIGTQYTGNSLGSGTDTWGGEDLGAVMYLEDIIKDLKRADDRNVTVIGGSRGATMMYMALRKGFRAKYAVAIAGVSDLEEWITHRVDMKEVFLGMFGADLIKALKTRSVVNWIDELPKDTKYILVHGQKDQVVSVSQSEKLATLMKQYGLRFELHMLQGLDHHITTANPQVIAIINSLQ